MKFFDANNKDEISTKELGSMLNSFGTNTDTYLNEEDIKRFVESKEFSNAPGGPI